MIAVARNISYGSAYSEYATQKDQAIFVGTKNMVCNWNMVFDNEELEDLWDEFQMAEWDYRRKGKEVTRNMFVIEYSPTNKESERWTNQDWFDHAEELLKEIDGIELTVPKRDKKTGEWILDEKGKKKRFPVKKTNLSNSKWAAMLHRDSASGIRHLHIMVSRFTVDSQLNENFNIAKRAAQAAEQINQRHGWTKAMDVRQNHIDEINHVINDVLSTMDDDKFSWDEFCTKINAATYIDYKGRLKNYTVRLHKDSYGNIDGYSVGRGKSVFSASELGQKLTNIPLDKKAFLKDTIYDILRGMKGEQFSWDEFCNRMAEHRCHVTLKHDSQDNVVNYSVEYDDKKYNASQIGAKLTAKKIIAEWQRIRKEEDKLKAKNSPTISAPHTPTKAETERRKAIDDGLKAVREVRDWTKREFSVRDIEDRLPEAIAAKAIDMNGADGWREPGVLDEAAHKLLDMVEIPATRYAAILEGVMGVVTNMALPPATQSIGGGGGSNDLPKKKDDDWLWWKKNGFTFKQGGGRGIKRR